MSTRVYEDDETNGATVLASDIDAELNKIRLDVRERLLQGGHFFAGTPATNPNPPATQENFDGRHAIGVEDDTHDNTGVLTIAWDELATTSYGRFYGSLHATTAKRTNLELIDGIFLGTAGDKLCHGIASGAYVRASVFDAVPASGRIPIAIYKVPTGSPARTLRGAGIIVGTKPTGGDIVVSIYKHAAPADTVERLTNGSGTLLGAVTLSNSPGTEFSKFSTTGFGDALAAEDELYADFGATNGALNATVFVDVDESA